MRTELKRMRAIEETPIGELRTLKWNVFGRQIDERLPVGLEFLVSPTGLALAHNKP